jgi:hypothetical protein
MTATETKRRTSRIARRLIVTLSAAAVVCADAAPIAAARTITIHKSFKLRPNSTASYELPRNPHLSLADAGYILTGPSLSVREDNLVDPFPHQPRDAGQISRDGVTVLGAGIARVGATPPLKVRVKPASCPAGSPSRCTSSSSRDADAAHGGRRADHCATHVRGPKRGRRGYILTCIMRPWNP